MKLFALFMVLWLFLTNGEQCGVPDPDLDHTHSFGEWSITEAATCTENGVKVRYCDCGEMQSDIIPVIEHTYVYNKCTICGSIITIPDCEHTDIRVILAKEATCTESGWTEGKVCAVCYIVIQPQEIVNATGHTEVIDAAIEATCTTVGYTEGKHCSTCNTIILAQQTAPMIDHSESGWIVDKEPTPTEDGKKHTECTMCGQTMRETIFANKDSEGLVYKVNFDNLSCTITGIGECTDTKIIIPDTIDGYTVTAIGTNAFVNCVDITYIEIPSTVTTIGGRAFYGCTGITEITIPESVSLIGAQIFHNASNLTTVYYNSSYSLQSNQFLNLSHITKIVFGGSKVPDYICYKNTNVKTIEILEGVESIGSNAFNGCTGLTSIVIPDSVTSIGSSAFSSCISLTDVYYTGSEAEWAEISIGSDNYYLTKATRHYNYVPEN